MPDVIIVGSGIVGLAHAVTALERGWNVRLFEKDGMPRGASVRNFGAIWPIAQPTGSTRNRALRGVEKWQTLSKAAGFSCENRGSLHVAYSDDAWQVLTEFVSLQESTHGSLELLSPHEIAQRVPHIRQTNLRGGLFSSSECVINPLQAIPALVKWLGENGVSFQFGTPVTQVYDHEIQTSGGKRYRFDKLAICSGDEVRLLYPTQLAATSQQHVKLQMMRTVTQPDTWRLIPIAASELTLIQYESFKNCPSSHQLAERLTREMPEYQKLGIHVLAVQHPNGELVIGDSHEYGRDFNPGHHKRIEQLILDYLQTFLNVEHLDIQERWNGYYLKAGNKATEIIIEPEPDVQLITGLGGAGMTLSFGLSEDVISKW